MGKTYRRTPTDKKAPSARAKKMRHEKRESAKMERMEHKKGKEGPND